MKLNRKLLGIFAVAAMIAIAGCGAETTEEQQKEIANAAGQNVSDVQVGASYYYEVSPTRRV